MIEITSLASASGPLTKRISLGPDGKLISDGSACVMVSGVARRNRLHGIDQFAEMIGRLGPTQAITLGALHADLPDDVEITTARRLAEMKGCAPPNLISRTAGHISYISGALSLALLDYDTKGMPGHVAARLCELGGFWSALVSVMPELAQVGRVVRRSTSSGIVRSDTGGAIKGSDGLHVFVLVQDGADVERFLKTLHDRCWLHGLGWMMLGAGGQFLERSIVDRMVCAGERLVFEGAPILQEPLVQDAALRAPEVFEGRAVDSISACRVLTIVERATVRDLKTAEMHRLLGAASKVRAQFVKERATSIAARTGITQTRAERMVKQQCGGVLLPGVELTFDADDMVGCTVADVLADAERFVGATLADPVEGVAYGRCKAKIMQRVDGSLWINSFAHGRTTYELKYDAAAVEAAIRAASETEAANVFVSLLLRADLEADDEQRLRELVSELAKVKARPLGAKIKAAKAEQARERAAERQEREAATRTDKRLRLTVPDTDGERLPVLRAIDDVLCAAIDDEPPMRDLDGHPVEVRTRPPMMLHELTAGGSNHAEPEKTRLPAPAMPLLTQHDRYSFAHTVERYIEYVNASPHGIRATALPPVFVDHYIHYRDSGLPRVGAVVTAPLVLADGALLSKIGLDRPRKLVFRIEPELLAILPKGDEVVPGPDRVARALDFLVNDWLCDVATDFTGKCVLVSLALTILERVLLPERPAYFVTAGKRGGGKTTTLAMVILAVTGKKPPAAAWSTSEDERRKALAAYLSEGLAAMVFDNIPLGTTISCPTIEKILTAETYSDRILGQTAIVTVPAFTILTLTGNNIGPKGDLASRSLVARLDVDRADPENRPFKHADPIAWTLANRGAVLRALYVVLLGNLQLKDPKVEKTRFKRWWHLVGSAVEHAADGLVKMQSAKAPVPGASAAKTIDFGAIFRDVEGDDEETSSLAEVLEVFNEVWPGGKSFLASDVAKLINEPMQGEADKARVLREYFDTSGRKSNDMSSRVVSRRLGDITDAPVLVGNRTMKLIKRTSAEAAEKHRSAWFGVRSL